MEIKKSDLKEFNTIVEEYWECKGLTNKVSSQTKEFTEEIVKGVYSHLDIIDVEIEKKLTNWNFERIGKVEKNILRIGLYEILYMDNIPYIVSINEAVEIAKKYGSKDADRFVNGVLDNIRKSLKLDDE